MMGGRRARKKSFLRSDAPLSAEPVSRSAVSALIVISFLTTVFTMRSLFALFSFCFGLLTLSPAALAQEAPDALVKRVTEEVLTIIKNDKELQAGSMKKVFELVDNKILPHFNFMRMTSLAVGRDWSKATPEQKQKLAAEFKILLVRTYANALISYRNQRVDVKPLRMAPTDIEVTVRTEVHQTSGQPVQLDYTLQKKEDGWKVYDVIVAGISLVTNYREQFTQEVRAHGIDGLIKLLVDKNNQPSATQTPAAAK
jgi:phospholipid transport system substrate-binding protein